MMHPDLPQLAAYLDQSLGPQEQPAIRAHVLTCPVCAARLERLRADAQMIRRVAASGDYPDLRAAVRARLVRRRQWPGLALGLAGACAALLLFAILLGVRSGGSIGRMPDQFFVTDRLGGLLVALDAGSGARLGQVAVGDSPTQLQFDHRRNRLYVLLGHGVVAVDPHSLAVTARWQADSTPGFSADMALDERAGRLYISWPDAGAITALDVASLTPSGSGPDGHISAHIGPAPGPLALAPNGHALYILDTQQDALWMVDLTTRQSTQHLIDRSASRAAGWLAPSADGRSIYMLRRPSTDGTPPELRLLDVASGQVSPPAPVTPFPPPWDLLLLDDGRLAIAHGDGQRGGIEIVAADGFRPLAQIDLANDQHHLAAGPPGAIFALNFSHGTVTRYDLAAQVAAWRTPPAIWQPWDGAYVPGGWRWPF